ncbi:RICIN domain-containing protein [Streptomyces sp. NPDC021093]|uniref:RICIN domain-containing protein n=1 Tax=Streptomyces sp. NPDC021093 TaxID=3365112 RepID=UPI003792A63E
MPEPVPRAVRTAAEFIEGLHALKEWSGLTYRELTARADAVGDVLPRSTVANMLARTTVPREELVAAYVRACGCGPSVVEEWLAVRKELAGRGERVEPEPDLVPVAEVPLPPGGKAPAGGPEAPSARRFSRTKVLAVALALTVVAATVAWLTRDTDPQLRPLGAVTAPGAGERTLRAVHSGLCLGERTGATSGKVLQAPCEGLVPQYSLVRMGEQDWRIASYHPEFEEGCMGVHWGKREKGAWVEDDECVNRDPAAETFRFEPVGDPVKGYRIRPQHTRMCLTVPGASRAEWTALEQRPCEDDAAGQLFRFDPEDK